MRVFLCLLIAACANGYRIFQGVNPVKSKPVIYAGSTKPLPLFDPLNLSSNQARIPFFREAELKHGRIGMVASVMIPLVDQLSGKPAIFEFQQLRPDVQLSIVGFMLVAEFASMLRGWEDPTKKPFSLRDDYQPGDWGFLINDLDDNEKSTELLNKELNNGRLAMIAAAGMIAQELVTRNTLF